MERKSYRRMIIRRFELISEELTMISDADSGMEKVIKISPSAHYGENRKKEAKPIPLSEIYDDFKEK